MNTILLSDLLKKDNGYSVFEWLSNLFVCKNKDVESFFKDRAVQSSKLYTSATYFILEKLDLLGYFTLATKMLTLNPKNISASQLKVIKRFASLDLDTNTYRLPAVLLAQFGRNFSKTSKSINGNDLMKIALERIEKAVSLTSGKVSFLECEPNKKIVSFYENCGFRLLDNIVCSKNENELVQMFRVL